MILDKKKITAIEQMIEGTPLQTIALDLDINRSTLYKWLKNPVFTRQLNQEMQKYAHYRLLLAIPHISEAVKVLVDILRDDSVKPADRISASKEILNLSSQALDQSLLVEVQELQAQLNSKNTLSLEGASE